MQSTPANSALLKDCLENLCARPELKVISPDPIELVHRYVDPRDIEIVGFIAASLAYGNVKTILRAIERILAILGPHPADAVSRLKPAPLLEKLSTFRHRFNTGHDVARLLLTLKSTLAQFGSLEALFSCHHDRAARDIGPALDKFAQTLLNQQILMPSEPSLPSGDFDFLLPLPSRGSACKRLNLFLRWMVRPNDGIDFGIWKSISPSQLIIPLDTHIARISRLIGLANRTSSDWKTALEITDALRQFDPADPIKYDFALCKLGMLGICSTKHDPDKCARCSLQPFCRNNK